MSHLHQFCWVALLLYQHRHGEQMRPWAYWAELALCDWLVVYEATCPLGLWNTASRGMSLIGEDRVGLRLVEEWSFGSLVQIFPIPNLSRSICQWSLVRLYGFKRGGSPVGPESLRTIGASSSLPHSETSNLTSGQDAPKTPAPQRD